MISGGSLPPVGLHTTMPPHSALEIRFRSNNRPNKAKRKTAPKLRVLFNLVRHARTDFRFRRRKYFGLPLCHYNGILSVCQHSGIPPYNLR